MENSNGVRTEELSVPEFSHGFRRSKLKADGGRPASAVDRVKTSGRVIRYEDFGAVGDGVTDDAEAIRAAHAAANEQGLAVEGRAGASYYIGALSSTIVIRTDTDWNGAELIFDDTTFNWRSSLRSVNVFTVTSADAARDIEIPAGMSLSKGQSNVGIGFDKPSMIRIEDSNEKIYKRYGENANGGVNKYEFIIVDENGNVDPATPIQYDYDTVTKITEYSIDDEPVCVGNGRIKTLAPNPKLTEPDYENNYCYYARGIMVNRSNTTVYGIEHRIYGEDMTIEIDRNGDGIIDKWGADKSYGVPYIGFFSFKGCNNVVMTDCFVQGHQAYSFYQGATRNEKGTTRNEMGSYDINATDCVNLKFLNIVQYENEETGEVITNRFMYHGIMGSNFCRNVIMDNCYVDRFDSHQGLHNATITNSTLGFGILVIGGGELCVENVYRISGGAFVLLRMDYNSVFDGDVIIKDCRAGSMINEMISARWVRYYNGLPNNVTNSLTIDGLTVDADNLAMYRLYGATLDSLTDDVNKLYLPTEIRLSNICASDGVTPVEPAICADPEIFAGVKVLRS